MPRVDGLTYQHIQLARALGIGSEVPFRQGTAWRLTDAEREQVLAAFAAQNAEMARERRHEKRRLERIGEQGQLFGEARLARLEDESADLAAPPPNAEEKALAYAAELVADPDDPRSTVEAIQTALRAYGLRDRVTATVLDDVKRRAAALGDQRRVRLTRMAERRDRSYSMPAEGGGFAPAHQHKRDDSKRSEPPCAT